MHPSRTVSALVVTREGQGGKGVAVTYALDNQMCEAEIPQSFRCGTPETAGPHHRPDAGLVLCVHQTKKLQCLVRRQNALLRCLGGNTPDPVPPPLPDKVTGVVGAERGSW